MNSVYLIHGFTGNRYRTWAHPDGTYWPRDLLPHDVKNVRVLTYGYNANIGGLRAVANANTLYEHSKGLARALTRCRADAPERPIVFVAHSLGGLVCEHMLVLDDEAARSITAATRGVILLGTPHRGSHLANWGVRFAKTLNLFQHLNPDILADLRPQSRDLELLEHNFRRLLQRRSARSHDQIKVFCFYEEVPTFFVGKVVKNSSAILPGYDSEGIQANHRHMTKFSGRNDNDYQKVLYVLKKWVNDLR